MLGVKHEGDIRVADNMKVTCGSRTLMATSSTLQVDSIGKQCIVLNRLDELHKHEYASEFFHPQNMHLLSSQMHKAKKLRTRD